MKVENVLNCSFNNWFPRFKKVTVKSIILPLSFEFVDYLLADGVFLPNSEDHKLPENEDESDNEEWDDDDEEDKAPHFPEFDQNVKSAIKALGGCVFPKLNWSCPKDAYWIALNKSLCCSCVTDIYLLLKSSEFITHDLTQPFKFCIDYHYDERESSQINLNFYLILRKWIEIDPSTEYRCFVRNNNLIAISQRDYTSYYDHIINQKDEIIEDIVLFFEEHIKDNFPDENYVFDIYRKRKNLVKLVDFNPFGKVTDSLLFEWEELENLECSEEWPEFRCNNFDRGVQPSSYLHYGMPKDVIDLSTGEDHYKLIDLLKLKRDSQVNYVSSEDEDTATL